MKKSARKKRKPPICSSNTLMSSVEYKRLTNITINKGNNIENFTNKFSQISSTPSSPSLSPSSLSAQTLHHRNYRNLYIQYWSELPHKTIKNTASAAVKPNFLAFNDNLVNSLMILLYAIALVSLSSYPVYVSAVGEYTHYHYYFLFSSFIII